MDISKVAVCIYLYVCVPRAELQLDMPSAPSPFRIPTTYQILKPGYLKVLFDFCSNKYKIYVKSSVFVFVHK